ncbi:AraC family transcriptional regulator [Microbacterium sp. zg-YB36]|uniref:helix-turn-helix domain-containing protein n=1 Tax=Microbacterium sp. zg-YB36 TaxID=2969407 RepID=UPI00214B4C30|nr:AraC family transcriptional regulator [Microbacterium sp. zg-YB36]MDL5352857.1 AraC family transcriptional regulator [Microbacterium sp. zg-YB36]
MASDASAGSGPVVVRHPVPTALRPFVAGILGFDEQAPPEGRIRVQPGGSLLVLNLSFAAPMRVVELPAGEGAGVTYQAFLAGLMPGPARTMFTGRHASVQIYLTPVGAHRLLAAPGTETAARVLPAGDVLPRSIRNLPDRLADAAAWGERFALVTDALLTLAASPAAVDELVPWMWRELRRSGGRVRVDQLARASGWSVRHVSHRFTESAGIPPKLAAQLIRFERAHAALSAASLADVAARGGYADQSHLAREVRRFAGETPTQLVRAERPTAFTALRQPPASPAP